jgi:hypothetical protein
MIKLRDSILENQLSYTVFQVKIDLLPVPPRFKKTSMNNWGFFMSKIWKGSSRNLKKANSPKQLQTMSYLSKRWNQIGGKSDIVILTISQCAIYKCQITCAIISAKILDIYGKAQSLIWILFVWILVELWLNNFLLGRKH